MGICVSCGRRERKVPEKRSAGRPSAARAKGAAAELLPRQVAVIGAMANSISNIKGMTNPLKGIVSKRRKRYIKDGFNLDLACILLSVSQDEVFNLLLCLWQQPPGVSGLVSLVSSLE